MTVPHSEVARSALALFYGVQWILTILLIVGLSIPAPLLAGPLDGDEADGQRAAGGIDFAHAVVPILRTHCVECHSGEKPKGGFSFDSRALVLDAEAVVVGDPKRSALIERIRSTDADEQMPPKGKARLTEPEIATLERWIAAGLTWEPGFSFSKSGYEPPLYPRRPSLPEAREFRGNPVDRIVDAYFEERKSVPPARVDDRTFARRVHLDIIGLPPTSTELDRFLSADEDSRRGDLVRQLLARDQEYAEHWMTFWNDLLRNAYAGTGFIDGGRKGISAWLYRSLLENKPYDVFVRELVAPSSESEGFTRGIRWRGNVNASQRREVQFSQSISQVFLGINMKCASCHDSFIDRWTLDEAYGLAAIYSDGPLELFRCDKSTGRNASPAWIFPELGRVDPKAPRDQRLEQLAALMTHKENGRTTRTVVNRLWHRFFGRGIVHPVDAMHTEPWSADLLDFLAVYLAENDYDLKKVMELVCTSETYGAAAATSGEDSAGKRPDSGGSYTYQGPVLRRMTVEQYLDSIRAVLGVWPQPDGLDLKRDGRGQGGQIADVLKAHPDQTDWGDRRLRTVFTQLDPLQAALGRPRREQVVSARPSQLSTLEAIRLANGERLAGILAGGAAQMLPDGKTIDTDVAIEALYVKALARSPSDAERAVALELIGTPPTRTGLEDFLWALFMLPEFHYVR